MKKLIDDLKENDMIMNDWYSTFEKGMPIAQGLIGALISGAKTWYCSLTKEYFYYFKIKNTFSYGGIKWDTVKKIKIADIQKIIWKPKTFSGYFTIVHNDGKLTGTLDAAEERKNNFESMLRFLKYECEIFFEGYLHNPDKTL